MQAYSATVMDSSPDASSGSELGLQVLDDELRQVRPLSAFASSSATVQIPAQAVSDDMHSGLFYDAEEERWVPFGAVYDEMDATYAETDFNNEYTADSQAQDQEGGLENWNYVSPFAIVEVSLDDVDDVLYRRFIIEGEEMLRRVEEDVVTQRLVESHSYSQHVESDSVAEESVISSGESMTRLEAVKTFLPDSLLEKLAAVANQSLRLRQKRPHPLMKCSASSFYMGFGPVMMSLHGPFAVRTKRNTFFRWESRLNATRTSGPH